MQHQYRITLPQATGEAIERIAALSGTTPPKIIRQWLTEAQDAFTTVADALEKVSQLEGEARKDFAAGFSDAIEHLNMIECEGREALGLLGHRAGRRSGGGADAGGPSAEPPSCNTGATNSDYRVKTKKGAK